MSSGAVAMDGDSWTPSPLFMIATALSAVAYGVVLSLCVSCFRTISRATEKLSIRKKAILSSYVTALVVLSTLALVQEISSTIFNISFLPTTFLLSSRGQSSSWILPFTVWGTDGFKMWRCGTLYSRYVPRLSFLLSVILFVFLGLMSLVSGILLLVSPFIPQRAEALGFTATPIFMVTLSAISNFFLSLFITVPTLVHQKAIQKVLGHSHGRPYTEIIIMGIGSCALVVIPTVSYIILFSTESKGSVVPLLSLPHLSIISPLLIINHVVDGRNMRTVDPTSIVHRELGSIRANDDFSSPIQLSMTQISTHFD